MHQFDSDSIFNVLTYREFIPAIRDAYSQEFFVPPRTFLRFGNGQGSVESTLLIMPGWQDGSYLGIKQVTLSPYNSRSGLPTLQGVYTLFDAKNGTPLALFDAKAITARRTAAKSAVAASFLAPQNAETLLMVGTGNLSSELIQAHTAVRDYKNVWIWERTPGNGKKVIERLPEMEQNLKVVDDLARAVPRADVISVATMSPDPLIRGEWLQPGQHLDMVGAYRTDMRESDDETLKRSVLFIDHDDAWHETGDLSIPLEEGIITRNDVRATLSDLCRESKPGRKSDQEITWFKSTGHAREDLTAALFVYQKLNP